MLTSVMRVLMTRSFKPFLFKGRYDNKLDYKNLTNLGLYIHIPFCKVICDFCPYCKVKLNTNLMKKYKDALLKEIDLVCKDLEEKKVVTSLYFGGGTPTLMIDDIKDIIYKLEEYFEITNGIGVEIHPSDINDEILSKLKSSKVTMISVGIQSFNNECLNKIGRKEDGFVDKLRLIKKYNFDVVDVDLIFGIPGQNTEILESDISIAFKNGATQVSTYPFIDFTFANNKHKPLSHKEKKKMLKALSHFCDKLELDRTSVWTFGKKNTLKYSSITRDSFLSFGVSATTLLKDVFKINTFSIEEYIARVDNKQLPTSLTLDFTKRQRAVYFLFWSAYTLTINKSSFEKIVGKPLNKMYGFEFWLAKKLGYVTSDKDNYYLTEKGSIIYHYIEQKYTRAYIDKMWNISRVVPFPERIILK